MTKTLPVATTEAVHLPWRTDPEFGHQYILGADGIAVADCSVYHSKRSSAENTRNAKAVVRAVNAHADLVKALEAVRRYPNIEPTLGTIIIGQIDAALARSKAQGGE